MAAAAQGAGVCVVGVSVFVSHFSAFALLFLARLAGAADQSISGACKPAQVGGLHWLEPVAALHACMLAGPGHTV